MLFVVPAARQVTPQESVLIVIKTAVARRYAKALLELLDASQIDGTRTGLTDLAAAVDADKSLKHVLASPGFSFDEKHAVLGTLSQRFGCPPVVNRFLAQLIKTNRIGSIAEIVQEFGALVDLKKGRKQVAVTSARPLQREEQEGLAQRLRDLLRQDVDLAFQTDAALVGGLRIRIDSTVFDSSVRTRLATMRSLVSKE